MTTWPNWVDLIVLTVVFTTGYNGFRRGFWFEFLNLAGAVVVTALTVNYATFVTFRLRPWIGSLNPILVAQLVFWTLFLVLRIGVRLLIGLVTRALKWEQVHWTLQTMGMVLGVARGLWWAGFLLISVSASGVVYLRESVEDRSVSGPRGLAAAQEAIEWVSRHAPGARYRTKQLVPPMRSEPTKGRSRSEGWHDALDS